MELATFLREHAASPLVWGEDDCSLFVANWLRASRGVDPALDLRGTYSCWLGAIRRIRRAGGLVWLFGPRLEAIGMHVTDAPQSGDVAVVSAPAGDVGAIRTAHGWAAKTTGGVIVAAFEPVMAWMF